MSSLRSIDIRFLDEIFEMEQGYVLDFSDRTLHEFFADELDVDIDDPNYSKDGTSKAKRLRCFLRTVDDPSASKALKALWQHRHAVRERRPNGQDDSTKQGRFLQLIDKLEGRVLSTSSGGIAPVAAFGIEKFRLFKERLVALNSLEPQPRGYAFVQLRIDINFRAFLGKFFRFFLNTLRKRFLLGEALFCGVLPDILADFHRASTFAKASADRDVRI